MRIHTRHAVRSRLEWLYHFPCLPILADSIYGLESNRSCAVAEPRVPMAKVQSWYGQQSYTMGRAALITKL
jgi:hypothetical protein